MTDKLAGPQSALGGALRQLSDILHGMAERPEEGAAVRAALAALATLADIERAAADLAAAGADLARQAEERERRCRTEVVEATTSLAGSVARSLNDLLTGVAVDTELALSRLPETDPIRKHLESVGRAAERGSVLARDLLAVGRNQVLHPRLLNLNELVADLEPALARLLGPRIQLVLDLAAQLPPVEIDPAGLEQLLLTLAVRAREAMAGVGRLGIWTALSSLGAPGPRERRVLLAITDSGEGMVGDDLAHLCEPFVPAGPGLARGGLGLASACGFVRQSGGTFEVYSRPGEGTIVRILLPAAVTAGVARSALSAGRKSADGGGTILLVEDEDNVRLPLAELLEDRGYLVLAAPDGSAAEALAALHDGPIHLMVTDVMMPGMNGVELARTLARTRPEMRVLVATGYPDALAAEGPAAGPPLSLLRKPFTSQILLRRVAEMLREVHPAVTTAKR
jgi:two-component system, cell cycle sensor histidine kinase and response regulator CckA